MTAIANSLPEDVRAARDGILAFVEREVMPRHAEHRALFDDPRRLSTGSDESLPSAIIRNLAESVGLSTPKSEFIKRVIGLPGETVEVRDGVVIVPREAAEETVARTEQVMSTESEMRKAILDGMDPEQAYLKFGKF